MKNEQIDQEVFNTLKKLIRKRFLYKIEQFVQYAVNHLPYTEPTVRSSIYRLIENNVIVPSSCLTRADILKNATRNAIYHFIYHHPGCILKEVKIKFNLGNHETRWHITMLEQFGFIRSRKIQHFVALFPIELESSYEEVLFLLNKEPVQKIIKLLEQQVEMSQTELKKALNLHHSTIQYYLRPLLATQLIFSHHSGRVTKYSLNHEKLGEIRVVIRRLRQKKESN